MYQTLPEFLMAPFSKREPLKDASYKEKYEAFRQGNKIRIENTCEIDGSWYVHMKLPSESNERVMYDVVFRFFLLNHDVGKDGSLSGHKVQFFSNSPSFIYNYSWLYKAKGYLIESLYGKMEKRYLDTRPKKENLVISYDKSIYFCVLFLTENQCKRLRLSNLRRLTVPEDRFIRSIDDVEYKNIERELTKEEAKLKQTKTSLFGAYKKTHKKVSVSHKRTPKRSKVVTGKSKITANKKKTASKSTTRKR